MICVVNNNRNMTKYTKKMQRAGDEDQLNGGIHGGKARDMFPSPKSAKKSAKRLKVSTQTMGKGKGGEC